MIEERPNRGKGLLLAPGLEGIGPGALLLLLEFIEAVGQITEAGQDGSALTAGRAVGVLAEGDIAPVVSAVFNG